MVAPQHAKHEYPVACIDQHCVRIWPELRMRCISMLQAQSVIVDTQVTTTKAASASQVLTSTAGFEGVNVRSLPQTYAACLLVCPHLPMCRTSMLL